MPDIWNILRLQIERISKPFPRAVIAFANLHREKVTPYLKAATPLVGKANHRILGMVQI